VRTRDADERARRRAVAREVDVEMNKGSALLLLSYVAPLVSAYAVFMFTSRVLSTSEFADFGLVNAGVAMANAVIAGGTIQAISRRVAGTATGHVARFRRAAVARQLGLSLVIGVVLAALSPLFARALGDTGLTVPFAVAAAIPAVYALLAVQQGALNGTGRLAAQGTLNLIVSTSRLLLVVGAVWFGFGVIGALVAIALAAALTFAASWLAPVDDVPSGSTAPSRPQVPRGATGRVRLKNDLPLFVVAQVLLQILLAADLFLLKAHVEIATSALIALYVAAQTVARIPYGLLLGVPQLAFSTSARERTTSSALAQSTGRTFALVTGLLALVLAIAIPLREPLLLVVYPESFRGASAFLALLLAGAGALAVGDIAQSMVSGARGPTSSVVVLAVAVVVEIMAALFLVPREGAMGAALASCIGASVLALAASIVFFARIRPDVPWAIVGTGLVLGAGSALASSLFATTEPTPLSAVAGAGALALVTGALFALSVRADLGESKPRASK